MIPDTVVFDGMMPRAWFVYDDTHREVRKKVRAPVNRPAPPLMDGPVRW